MNLGEERDALKYIARRIHDIASQLERAYPRLTVEGYRNRGRQLRRLEEFLDDIADGNDNAELRQLMEVE